MNHELKRPAAVETALKAIELARIWAIDGKQIVSLRMGIWEDPASWGIILVDFARHLAHAYELNQGIPAQETLNRIRQAFDAEWSHPTDVPTGGMED